jgi:Flp pilus assembly protein TadG
MKRIERNPVIHAVARKRQGATAVECAIVLSAFFIILFGMLDLGLAVLDYNTLTEATRRLCRQAIVHGQLASPQMTPWGPTTVTGTASDGTAYGQALSAELATFTLNEVHYAITWPDGANSYDSRVQVTVTYNYQPMMPLILGTSNILLQTATMMHVQH